MRAIILVGHGSLRAASGAAMLRLAARGREAGIAPLVAAGFLNYSRPPFAEVLARCVAQGADEVVIVPYFLIPGKFVTTDIPRLLASSQAAHPGIRFQVAQPFGDHPRLADLVLKRAAAAVPHPGGNGQPPPASSGLLLIAHGSPDPAANQPIEAVAQRIRERCLYQEVRVGFLGLNAPDIPTAIRLLCERGVRQVIAVPYLLQLGGHVAEDLPQSITTAQIQHAPIPILLSEHLAYDPLLVTVIADRAKESVSSSA